MSSSEDTFFTFRSFWAAASSLTPHRREQLRLRECQVEPVQAADMYEDLHDEVRPLDPRHILDLDHRLVVNVLVLVHHRPLAFRVHRQLVFLMSQHVASLFAGWSFRRPRGPSAGMELVVRRYLGKVRGLLDSLSHHEVAVVGNFDERRFAKLHLQWLITLCHEILHFFFL